MSRLVAAAALPPHAVPVRVVRSLGGARAFLVKGTLLVARARTPAETERRKLEALAECGAVELVTDR